MSAFHGPQGRGAARQRRQQKRADADKRNARTPLERTPKFRRDHARVQAAIADAKGAAA